MYACNRIAVVGLLAILATLAICGCSTPIPPRTVIIPETTLNLDEQERITYLYGILTHRPGILNCGGFTFVDGIHCMWSGERDANGEPLPDFEVLGHEMWHLINGDFHRGRMQ